jgi:hypothetical protein
MKVDTWKIVQTMKESAKICLQLHYSKYKYYPTSPVSADIQHLFRAIKTINLKEEYKIPIQVLFKQRWKWERERYLKSINHKT